MSAVAAELPRRRLAGGSLRRNRRWALVASYFFLILFAIFFLIPPYYQLVTATKSSAEVSNQNTNPWLPSFAPTADNIDNLWNKTDFPIYLRNTALVTVCVVALTMVIAVPAAFSLGRMKFWGSGILATGVFLTYLVPESLLFLPLFKVVERSRAAQLLLGAGAGLSDADRDQRGVPRGRSGSRSCSRDCRCCRRSARRTAATGSCSNSRPRRCSWSPLPAGSRAG